MPAATIPPLPFYAEEVLNASEKDKAQLKDIHALLDKLFIRNRNQHRRNHWFKSLWHFRKEMRLLVEEMEHKKKKGAAEQIVLRLKYWDEKHFTQLVAVGPFAALGLALMASVARVCRITGITAVYEEMASDDVKGVLTAMDEGFLAEEYGGMMDIDEPHWDEGQVVEREE
ncbi:Ribonuclease MRP protein subunit rmp1 [Paraconiothyrium brasiliense]|uniref:Ribonuclease MRP protein subunit rmp1 n=1 Tax=Paraconiothyrium brasiliense TaxID=300254 RepID=A0ABR3RV74_9PLEO